MKEKEFVIQQMPAPTFRWLKMNESKVEIPEEVFPYSLSIGGMEKEKGIKKESVSSPFSGSMSISGKSIFRLTAMLSKRIPCIPISCGFHWKTGNIR